MYLEDNIQQTNLKILYTHDFISDYNKIEKIVLHAINILMLWYRHELYCTQTCALWTFNSMYN